MKLVGLDEQLSILRDRVKNWNQTSKPLLLAGPTGTGKTASVHQIANELGYNVWTIDCSYDFNIKDVEKVMHKKLVPTILLIENVDRAPTSSIPKLTYILPKSPNPVVLTTTSLQDVHPKIVDMCEVVRYYRLRAKDLLKIAEEASKVEGLQPNYGALTGDARQAVLSVFGSMGYEEATGVTKTIEKCLKSGDYEDADVRLLIHFLDNSYLNFYGNKLFWFIKAIQIADKTKRTFILNGFKVSNPKVDKSYFLSKLSLVK